MEYSVNAGAWTDAGGTTIDNIAVNATDVVKVRVKATAQQPASVSQDLTVALGDIKPAAAPTTGALAQGTDAGTVKVTGVTAAMEYSVNAGAWTDAGGTTIDNIAVNAADVVKVRVKATAQQPASLAQDLTVALGDIKPAAAPAGVISAANDNITGLVSGTVYEVEIGGQWFTFAATDNAGNGEILKTAHLQGYNQNDEVKIRIKATVQQPASEVQTITVGA